MKAARNVFLSLLRNITVLTTKRHRLASLAEAPGAEAPVQSPWTACTLPGPISPPLALRGTARVSCLWLLAHSIQDTPKKETHDEYAWKTSLPIVRGHSSCRNRQGCRFRTKTHPRTPGGAGKPETPCFPPSSSWEEYNSALRQPPRKLLWEQTLLLTIQKWDKSISNPLEKLPVSTTRSASTTRSETLHFKGAVFPDHKWEHKNFAFPIWPEGSKAKMRVPLNEWIDKSGITFAGRTVLWGLIKKITSNCVTYPLTLGCLRVPGSVLWASDIFGTNQTIARLALDSNSFRFNISNLLHR